jgi:hypothetical protein
MNSVEGEITGIKYYFQEFEIHHFIRFYEICLQKLKQIVSIICHFVVKKEQIDCPHCVRKSISKAEIAISNPVRLQYCFSFLKC